MRSRRCVEPGPDPADRHAGGPAARAGERFRRRLHRQPEYADGTVTSYDGGRRAGGRRHQRLRRRGELQDARDARHAAEDFVRPEEVTMSARRVDGAMFQVKDWVYLGSGREMWVDGPVPLRVARSDAMGPPIERGARVALSWRPERALRVPGRSRQSRERDVMTRRACRWLIVLRPARAGDPALRHDLSRRHGDHRTRERQCRARRRRPLPHSRTYREVFASAQSRQSCCGRCA